MLKSRRGQRKNLISRRTIDLPNVRNKENTLKKLNTVSEISRDFDNRVNICIIKVQIEKGKRGNEIVIGKIMVEISWAKLAKDILKHLKIQEVEPNGINPQIQNKIPYSNLKTKNPKTTFENIRGK